MTLPQLLLMGTLAFVLVSLIVNWVLFGGCDENV